MQEISCVDIAQDQTLRLVATRSFRICTPSAVNDTLMTAIEGGRVVLGSVATYRNMTTLDLMKLPALRFPSGSVRYPSRK